jgi:hypothetical protein
MSAGLKLRYLGWSSFVIESANGNLSFDPLYRSMYGARWASLDDFRDSRVICVTHGHHDHYIDIPTLLGHTDAVVVASNEICDHLNFRYKVNRERLLPIEPFQEVGVSDFKITAFEWDHRKVSISRLFRGGLFRGQFFSSFQAAWHNLFKVPFHAPYFGFYVEGPENMRLMNYCEGFSNLMRIEAVRELAQRFRTDILLAGMQLDFERQLTEGVAAVSPNKVVLFHPHEVLFEKIGLRSSPPQVFVEGVRRALPEAEVIVARPQSSIAL